MLPRQHPDRIRIAFDDHRLVTNAGLVLPATLALRLGLPELVHNHLDLGRAQGRANTGDKMLRAGGTASVLGFTAKASSTLGDYLTDKTNEAIASPVRFQGGNGKGAKSVKHQAYEDYVERMRRIFAECRRVIKDDGIMTIMFTHKTTDAWDALTIGNIEAGFRITATWPVKTESDSSVPPHKT